MAFYNVFYLILKSLEVTIVIAPDVSNAYVKNLHLTKIIFAQSFDNSKFFTSYTIIQKHHKDKKYEL